MEKDWNPAALKKGIEEKYAQAYPDNGPSFQQQLDEQKKLIRKQLFELRYPEGKSEDAQEI